MMGDSVHPVVEKNGRRGFESVDVGSGRVSCEVLGFSGQSVQSSILISFLLDTSV